MLIIALGFTTTLAIRYWNEVTKTKNVTIILGNEDQVEMNVIDVSPTFEGTLVPKGYAFWKGEVDEVHFEYEISITDRELIQTMNLVVEAINIKIGGSTVYAHLVEVTVVDEVGRKVIDFDGETARINIIVRLLEPVDASEAAETGKVANVDDAEVNSISIGGNETLNATGGLDGAMFTTTVEAGKEITVNGDEVEIKVTVKFVAEPKDFNTYNLVAEKDLTLNVTFTVELDDE